MFGRAAFDVIRKKMNRYYNQFFKNHHSSADLLETPKAKHSIDLLNKISAFDCFKILKHKSLVTIHLSGFSP